MELGFPCSSSILEITKSLEDIEENAWLRLCTNRRLHHGCSTGAATGRCVHSHPNLAQVLSDERFQDYFTTEGQVMVGCDLSGVELRMLAHYLPVTMAEERRYPHQWDIHQVNADKIGVSRNFKTSPMLSYMEQVI